MVHLGLSYGVRSLSDDTNAISGSGKADFGYETTNGSNLKLFDTPDIAGFDNIKVSVLEFAAMNGPLSFQAEYAMADANGTNDYSFTAWYVNIGYTLTGEHRSYKPTDGEFKRLKPASEGAWELALRLDHIDLNDGDVNGGSGDRYTIALNRYINYNFRVMFDYSRVYEIENGPVTHTNGDDADDIDTFTLRAQWAF